MYILSYLKTEQGIQGTSRKVFVFAIWDYNINTNEENNKNDNTCVISLLLFYDNRKMLTFKVLSVVVYFFLDIKSFPCVII